MSDHMTSNAQRFYAYLVSEYRYECDSLEYVPREVIAQRVLDRTECFNCSTDDERKARERFGREYIECK